MSSHSTSRYVPISTKMDNPALSGSSGDVDADSASVEAAGIPATCSSQQLMPPPSDTASSRQSRYFSGITGSEWFTVTVLCFVNLINYMDRFTIAGVLTDIQEDFDIGDDDGGLLQTAFVVSYMVCAPLFGYLGDRYSRRWIMAVGVLLWSTTTILGSFMYSFGWFITFRGLVGIGEASYSTIAPTIISDLFVGSMRTKMLAMFYFAIPVGSGFGYIVGSETARALDNWRWALRVTPFLGIAAVVLILCTKEPERGASEGSNHLLPTTYAEDLQYLVKNRSFMLSTGGFTCVAFVTGALAWWGPKFIFLGMRMHAGNENLTLNDVSYKFGIIAMLAGLIGVPLGSVLAQRFRPSFGNCDPYICATGLLMSAPMVYLALVTPQVNATMCFLFVFLAQITLNLCWAIVADILLFGAITMVAGILGVPLGPFIAHRLVKFCRNIDPLLCAIGLFSSAFLLGIAMIMVTKNSICTFILIFFGQLALNVNWAIVADILLYVVIPTRRSTAEAFQILLSHALGDAGSPYLVGVISEAIKKHMRLTAPAVNKLYSDGLETLALTLDGNLLNGTSVQNATSAVLDATSSMVNATSSVFNATSSMLTTTPSMVSASSDGLSTTSPILDAASEMLHSIYVEYQDMNKDSMLNKFKALQYALFTTTFVEVLGGIFFLLTAVYIIRDKQRAISLTRGEEQLPVPIQSARIA